MSYEKIYIFFDTNILENRFNGNCLNVSQPKFGNIYYQIQDFILDNKLEETVKLCIPEIVLMEMKKHLINCYKSQSDSLASFVDNFKKTFGDMIEIIANQKICEKTEQYIEYIEDYFNDVLEKNSNTVSIVPYPRDTKTIERIVHKAMHTERPFRKAKGDGNKKEYTDAGLKDAFIYETVLQYSRDNFCILITNDNDFDDLFTKPENSENIVLCNNENDLKELLLSKVNILSDDYNITKIIKIISEDEYFIKTLLSEIKFNENARYEFKHLVNFKEVENGTEIEFFANINGINYRFTIIYELNAKELVDILDFGESNEK